MDALHFLRPLWLLAIPAAVLTWWLVRRRTASQANVGVFIAPHLRDALTVNRNVFAAFRPVDGVALTMIATAVATAGPVWSKQVSPWFEETAPLVIALEVTDSMRSNDVLPTRLDRARFKIHDLVEARTGARTALIAYAGSAHIVIPPSTDLAVLDTFLEGLDPAIMPTSGDNAAAVLPLAAGLLGDSAAVGTLLFVNDGFGVATVPALTEFAADVAAPAMTALVVGTDSGGIALLPDGAPVLGDGGGPLDTSIDNSVLRSVASSADIAVVRATTGDADINELIRKIESDLQQADDPDAQWRDQAWLLLWPAMLLALFWFRRGWTMRW